MEIILLSRNELSLVGSSLPTNQQQISGYFRAMHKRETDSTDWSLPDMILELGRMYAMKYPKSQQLCGYVTLINSDSFVHQTAGLPRLAKL